jgi:hypothetical protein
MNHNNNFTLILFSIFLFANTVFIIKCQTNDVTSVEPPSSTNTPDGLFIYFLKFTIFMQIKNYHYLKECNSIPNATCIDCLKNSKCFFCNEDNTCRVLKIDVIFPKGCSSSKSRWFDCSSKLVESLF